MWSYERKRRRDKTGMRWHIVSRSIIDPDVAYGDRPFELYFRNDERTEFGLVRFEKRKDNPARNYEVLVFKIMNNAEVRRAVLDPDTKNVWRRRWKSTVG